MDYDTSILLWFDYIFELNPISLSVTKFFDITQCLNFFFEIFSQWPTFLLDFILPLFKMIFFQKQLNKIIFCVVSSLGKQSNTVELLTLKTIEIVILLVKLKLNNTTMFDWKKIVVTKINQPYTIITK